MKKKCGVAPLMENNNDRTSMKFDDRAKANILQRQFCSVFTEEPNGDIPKIAKRAKNIISSCVVTEARVRKLILELNLNKSCGPDNIHPRLLKELVDMLSGPIALLLNKTLEEGDIPLDWKMAFVSPIFKKGSKNNVENYRPISLTSIISKIMERNCLNTKF